jgi:hypothetical protein
MGRRSVLGSGRINPLSLEALPGFGEQLSVVFELRHQLLAA